MLGLATACGGAVEELFADGGAATGGGVGSTPSDASGPKDGASGAGPDVRDDGSVRSDAGPLPDAIGAGGAGGAGPGGAAGTGNGGAAGSRTDAGPGGAGGNAGTTGSGGAGGGGAGQGGGGGAGQGGGGRGGTAGAGGSGGAGTGGAAGTGPNPGDAGRPDGDAALPDASTDAFDGGPIDVGPPRDAPIVCDKPAAPGGVFDDNSVWALAGVAHVTGAVSITLNATADLNVLRCLKQVDGDFWIRNSSGLVTAVLPNLQSVAGSVAFESNLALTSIALPMLSAVGKDLDVSISVSNQPALTSVAAPLLAATPSVISIRVNGRDIYPSTLALDFGALTTVGGSLELLSNEHLPNLDGFSHVSAVMGDLSIRNNLDLVTVSLPSLTSVTGGISASEQWQLTTIALPALTSVGQSTDRSIDFRDLPGLFWISMPKLASTPAGFYLSGNGQPGAAALALDFRALTSIGGPFIFERIYNLTTLEGFPVLATIGGAFQIFSTQDLQSIALPALATVSGDVLLQGGDALIALSLPSLARVIGILDIEFHPALATIALPQLSTVVALQCANLPALGSISAPKLVSTSSTFVISRVGDSLPSGVTSVDFAALTTVGGMFLIAAAPHITSLSFPVLGTVGENVQVSDNPALTSATFPSLASVVGGVQVASNEALSAIAFPLLTSVGGEFQAYSLQFESLPALATLAVPKLARLPSGFYLHNAGGELPASPSLMLDFGAVEEVKGRMEVSSTPNLQSLTFPKLGSVGQSLLVYDDRGLASISLPQLANVGGSLHLRDDLHLATIALPLLANVGNDIDESIRVENLPVATSIALPKLATTTGGVRFSEIGGATPAPGNLTLELGALTSVGSNLYFQYLRNLPRLTGLTQLTTVNGHLVIGPNDILAELSPPVSTTTVSGVVQVAGNPSLPTCVAKAFAMACTSTAGSPIVTGNKADSCGE